jgi:flagellar motor switch protein FliG/type III secretory pathway lipoprotein EscJ
MAAADLAAAQAALAAKDVAFRIEGGKILAFADNSARAKTILAEQGLLAAHDLAALQKLAAQDDIWCTQAQAAKRWQAAKMATLGRMIQKFPQIRTATVLFEEGEGRSLGGGGSDSTASVQVELKPNLRMTAQLASAITDLVCGSVSGLKPANVRIVETSGKSYRAASDGMDALAAAEGYYCDKIRSALAYIGEPIVTVQADMSKTPARCSGVWVSIPRAYLAAQVQTQFGWGAGDREFQSVLAATVEKTRQVVRSAIGLHEPIEIQVDWHPDQVTQAALNQAPREASQWVLAFGVAAAVALIACLVALWRRHDRGAAAVEPAAQKEPAASEPAPQVSGLRVLQTAPIEAVIEFLGGEHPQTIAVVLSQMGQQKAAAIMPALAADVQAEVERRMESLEKVDDNMLAEVERALAGRLSQIAARSAAAANRPGSGAIVDVGEHAAQSADATGAAAQRQAPQRAAPAVAASVRNRMFVFEDIITLGDASLAPVLESMDARQLSIALRTASRELAQKVLACLSAPAAKRLRAQMEKVGPVRLSDVESAQQRALEAILAARQGQYVAARSPEVVA